LGSHGSKYEEYAPLNTLKRYTSLVGLLWTKDRPVAETYLTIHNIQKIQISMAPVGFEPTISVSECPQTYALERAAIGIGLIIC